MSGSGCSVESHIARDPNATPTDAAGGNCAGDLGRRTPWLRGTDMLTEFDSEAASTVGFHIGPNHIGASRYGSAASFRRHRTPDSTPHGPGTMPRRRPNARHHSSPRWRLGPWQPHRPWSSINAREVLFCDVHLWRPPIGRAEAPPPLFDERAPRRSPVVGVHRTATLHQRLTDERDQGHPSG
jgi:hypothetical protein